jgi:hypothetical protein
VSDAVLDVFVPSGSFEAIPDVLRRRYEGVADAIALRMPAEPSDDGRYAKVVAALQGRAEGAPQ